MDDNLLAESGPSSRASKLKKSRQPTKIQISTKKPNRKPSAASNPIAITGTEDVLAQKQRSISYKRKAGIQNDL